LVEAKAQGAGGDSEAFGSVGAEGNAFVQESLQALPLVAEGVVVVEQLLSVGPRESVVVNGPPDAVGVVVGGLAGAAGLLGLAGDVTVLAAEDGSGVADPQEGG
jgi:hypothetical protein